MALFRADGDSVRVIRPLVILLLIGAAACCAKQKNEHAAAPLVPTASVPTAPSATLLGRPHVTIVALSDWQSVLKPCGCTAELQRGGIERNSRFLADLRRRDDSVVLLHAGGLLVEDEAPRPQQVAQRSERMRTFAQILERLDVAGVALSHADLAAGGKEVAALYEGARWPLLAGPSRGTIKRAVASRLVQTASGVRVGLLAVDVKDDADLQARHERIGRSVAGLREQGAQVCVVLSNLGLRNSRRLARAVAGLDVVVVGAVPERFEPVEDVELDDGAILLRAPRHGAFMAVLTLAPGPDATGPWQDVAAHMPDAATRLSARIAGLDADMRRFAEGARKTVAMERTLPYFQKQRRDLARQLAAARHANNRPLPAGRLAGYASVGLPWSAPAEPEIAKLVNAYDARVSELNAKHAAKPAPANKGEAAYVGAAVCVACHLPTKPFMANDLHTHAWTTLQKVNKTRDLDCVPCHATGFGQPGGSAFDNIDTFAAVQCESCHGPGSLHVGAPKKGAQSHLTNAPDESVCLGCHTPEHAPRFDFAAYRRRLIVPGHGLPAAAKQP